MLIQSNPTIMDWNAFLGAFEGGTAKQRQEFVQNMKKLCKEVHEEGQLEKESQLIPLKQLSLSEFTDHIE